MHGGYSVRSGVEPWILRSLSRDFNFGTQRPYLEYLRDIFFGIQRNFILSSYVFKPPVAEYQINYLPWQSGWLREVFLKEKHECGLASPERPLERECAPYIKAE
ncbi:hypothetical protein AVEN_50267-1 [Araneus ventricosus]|uniref:Uncharacterized protein n=1 Tax=Araneus ventricosus TaxID=182803 RepID=A0A4Y2R7J8_ARAVE|nr:hypothetical protein AVEN_243062-1 [Araneus ventricosus]GBN71033.1 hypothetical protein AVEN_2633-1 [Araneus ventricosus]GBN71708.1 hypothetical protein AVEN_50267-1 [Araneus ventricosus]